MAQEVYKYLRRDRRSLKEIIFCLYDQEALVVFNKGVIGYLTYVTEKLGFGPYITVDAIIELDGGIVLIERSNPPFGWALPGGFVDYGESLESAVIREAKEETGLDIAEVRQMHTYSAPERDPRFHTINTVFIARAAGTPLAGDDAKGVRVVKLDQLAGVNLAFDHRSIIADYQACKGRKCCG
jgi:ADP-ribose pyrophosphatase YjhB (NUDIX family)